ncbi:MAG: hypothetical protein HY043_04965, partial [Verrucomicrobia bacterium]|nr:hypothetical protein [Verrucomicrobiota bacterium]
MDKALKSSCPAQKTNIMKTELKSEQLDFMNLETQHKLMNRHTTTNMNRQTTYTKQAWRLASGVFAALALWVMAAGVTAQAAGFAAGPATIISEDCTNVVVNGVTNIVTGVIDPGEQITMSFVITNNTGANTTFLFASLQAANNVTAPSAPQIVGVNGLLAPGATWTNTFTFVASGGCGGQVTPVLSLQDGVSSAGTLTYQTFPLGQSYVSSLPFSSTNANVIPLSGTGNGPASLYPDNLTVSGVNSSTVSSIALYLNGFSHANPGDVSVLLVSPNGQKVLAMGGAGGANPVSNFIIKIADAATNSFSSTAALVNGVAYKPADLAGAAFDNPAPAGPYASSLSNFVGPDVNGSWQLFVFDNHAGASSTGSMTGWTLEFITAQTVCCLSPNLPQISLFPLPPYSTPENVAKTVNVNLSSTIANVSNIVLTASSTNTAVLPVSGITFGGAGAARTVTLTPAANTFGTSKVTITATDTSGLQNSVSFVLDVQFVNNPPTISALVNQATSTNGPPVTQAFTVGDVETPAANLLFFASSSDTTLVPNSNIVFGGSGANRTITVTPGGGTAQGQATITVSVVDGNQGIAQSQFTVTVGGSLINPSISLVGSVPGNGTNNSGVSITFSIAISDVQTPNAFLNVSGTSSNPGLVPNSGIAIAAPSGNTNGSIRSVTITPTGGQFGATTITLTVKDTDNNTGSIAVSLVYNFVNQAPSIVVSSSVPIKTLEDNAAIISLTVNDIESTASGVNLSIDPTSPAIANGLVQANNVGFSGTGGGRIMTILPNGNLYGTNNVTVIATDGNGATSSVTFSLEVAAVNDAPSFTKGADVVVDENSATKTVTGWATNINPGPAINESSQTVSFTVSAADNSLFATNPAVSSNGTLTFTPAAKAHGVTTVNVQAVDSGPGTVPDVNTSAVQTFVITINAINQQPSFALNTSLTNLYPSLLTNTIVVAEDSGANTFANLMTNITAGAANESAQVLTFSIAMVVTNNAGCDTSLFATNPVINPANGTLTFAPKANANGTAVLTVTLKDNGGTANGGVDTSASVTFTIVVTPVADLPTITQIGDATNTVHSVRNNPSAPASFTINDPDSCPASLPGLGVTLFNVNNAIVQSITIGVSTGGNRVLIITPVPNLAGLPVVNVGIQAVVTNATGSVTNTFNYIVENVNTPPVIGAIGSQSVNDNSGPTAVSFTVDDPGETVPGSLVVTATSSSQANIADANIFIANLGGTNRTLIFTPSVTTSSTNVTITVKATDDGTTPGGPLPVASSTKQFTVNITHVNQGPTIAGIVKQFTFEGSTTNINFTVGDFEDLNNLTLSATSTNQTLLPDSSLTFGGTGANRFITITPAAL